LDRVFLDANVLFSAAYLEFAGLNRLWDVGVQLLSSTYAIEEAKRNLALDRPDSIARFNRLLKTVAIVDPPRGLKLPEGIRLDPKDQPILLAAIHGKADFLLTGDVKHFGHLYGKQVEGVLVLRPAQYFERFEPTWMAAANFQFKTRRGRELQQSVAGAWFEAHQDAAGRLVDFR
jgi:uncharacterized protein